MTQGVAIDFGGPAGRGTSLNVTPSRNILRFLIDKFAISAKLPILGSDAKRLMVRFHRYDASLFIVLRKETPK